MRHATNRADIVTVKHMPGGVTIRVYIYDEANRFVTCANLTLTPRDFAHWQAGIEDAKDQARMREQGTLPW